MKNFLYLFSVLLFSLFAFSFVSCKKKTVYEIQPEIISETKSSHNWYYFSENSFVKIDRPQNAPSSIPKPWTEAIRISSAVVESRTDFEMPKAYATVNRSGILIFNGNQAFIYNDNRIFSGRTAGNMVFAQETPVFSVYRSTFFNENKASVQAEHPFLISFNTQQNISYPLINIENLSLEKNDEIIDFIYDGKFWTCCVKKTDSEKISFSYLTFQPKENITLLSPYKASEMLVISDTDVSEFRNARKPKKFSSAPERLRELLQTIPKNINFSVKVSSASGHSPREFIKSNNPNSETEDISAKAMITDTWIGCLFNDGTLYLNGALFERPLMNKGRTFGIRLPKLPANYIYGDFVISGTMLYASWEETSFYKTNRSGFISVNLDEILYK